MSTLNQIFWIGVRAVKSKNVTARIFIKDMRILITRGLSNGKRTVATMMMAGIITSGSIFNLIAIKMESQAAVFEEPQTSSLATIQGNSLLAVSGLAEPKIVRKINMIITAYSSTPEETDSTPFITASGINVRDGIVANNYLAFGTKVRIPALYGGKIFNVQDRMHSRMGNHRMDIWFPTKEEAKNFGAKVASIEIMED